MKRLLCLGLLAITLAASATERDDTAIYSGEERALSASPATAQLAAGEERATHQTASEELATLRTAHARQLEELKASAAAARSSQDELAIENQIQELKETQLREELQLLIQQADARGDASYASSLREALNNRRPAASTVTVLPVRDPQTGEQIGEQEVTR